MAIIYVTNQKHRADLKIYRENQKHRADMLIFVENQKHRAKGDCLWFYTDQKHIRGNISLHKETT